MLHDGTPVPCYRSNIFLSQLFSASQQCCAHCLAASSTLSWETQPRKQIVSQAVTMTAQQGFSASCACTKSSQICLLLLQAHLLSAQQYSWKCCIWNQRSLSSAKKYPEVVSLPCVQYSHIQDPREKGQPCCCTPNLLAGPGPNCVDPICFWREGKGIIIEIAVRVIKIQAIKWGMLHLMKFHLIQMDELTAQKKFSFRSAYTYLHNLLMYMFKPETIFGTNTTENTILWFNDSDVYSLA